MVSTNYDNPEPLLDARELAHVLAGLRKLQREGYDEADTWIATDAGDDKWKLMSQT